MYKTRFNKWGLQKTLRFQQVGELLRQNTDRAAVGKDSVRLIRGRPVDDKRLKKYLRNLPADRHSQLAELVHNMSAVATQPPTPAVVSTVLCRTPSPGPSMSYLFPLRPPDHLLIPEESIASMRTYVGGALSSGMWKLEPTVVLKAGPLFKFWNLGRTAKRLLKAGQTKEAFQVLHTCFHEYKALLVAQSPLLFPYTYTVCLHFADGYPELYISFLRYVSDLARIVHGEHHPLHTLLANMLRMGPEAAKQNVVSLSRAYLDLCQTSPGSLATLDFEMFLVTHFGDMKLHSWAVAEEKLQRLMAKLEPHRDDDVMEAIWIDARDDLSAILIHQNRYGDAADILKVSLASRILPNYPLLQVSTYRNLFIIARDTGNQEEAVQVGHTMVRFAYDNWGMGDSKTVTLLNDLITYLRKIEMVETADLLDKDFKAAMDELSKGIEVFDLGV